MNTLLVYRLAIQSSYADNVEQDADDERFDTVQWWLAPDQAWRIRTYALDHDVHLHQWTGAIAPELARQNTEKHYEDVIADAFEVAVPSLDDADALQAALRDAGGAAAFEVDRKARRFLFWNPHGIAFEPRSEPE